MFMQKVLYQLSHPSSSTEDLNSKSFKHFNIKACKIRLGMFVPAFNSITCEAEAGVALWVVSQANHSGLHCEILFQKKHKTYYIIIYNIWIILRKNHKASKEFGPPGIVVHTCNPRDGEANGLQQVWNRPGLPAGFRPTPYFKWESFLFYFLINGKTQVICDTNRVCNILFSLTKHAREGERKRERTERKGGTPGSKFILHPLILKGLCEGRLKAIARTQIINPYYGMLKEKPEVGQRHGVLGLRKPAPVGNGKEGEGETRGHKQRDNWQRPGQSM